MIRQFLPEPGQLDSQEAIEDWYFVPSGPHLRVNFVISLDGAVEIGGRSRPLGGPADRAAFMAQRAVADVILVGAGTARAENYGPVRLDADVLDRRGERGQPGIPPLALITASGDLDVRARLFEDDQEVIVFTTELAADRHPELADVADVVTAGLDMVDAAAVVSDLRRRGRTRILCEGGPALTGTLLHDGLVDELCLTLSPLLAGFGHRRISDGWGVDPLSLRLLTLIESDGMLLARYAVLDSEDA
jgi:riboflavin biosynthesis pyrimidine reductase